MYKYLIISDITKVRINFAIQSIMIVVILKEIMMLGNISNRHDSQPGGAIYLLLEWSTTMIARKLNQSPYLSIVEAFFIGQ